MRVRSIEPNGFRVDADGEHGSAVLLGGYSPTSKQFHFPRQIVCPYSGAEDVVAVDLSRDATVWGWTVVTTAPPGYTGAVPYGFGVVELTTEQLRIVTRLQIDDVSELEFGDSMQLSYDIVSKDDDGTDVAAWAFTRRVR